MESRAKNPQRLEAYSFPIRLFAISLWSLTQYKEHNIVLSTNNTVASIRESVWPRDEERGDLLYV